MFLTKSTHFKINFWAIKKSTKKKNFGHFVVFHLVFEEKKIFFSKIVSAEAF